MAYLSRFTVVVTLFCGLLGLSDLAQAQFMIETKVATNIRKKPATNAKLVVKVPAKTKLKVLSRNDSLDIKGKKSWLKVETDDGKVGWLATWVVGFVRSEAGGVDILSAPMGSPSMDPAAAAPVDSAPAEPPMESTPALPAEPSQPAAPAPDVEILDSVNDTDLTK